MKAYIGVTDGGWFHYLRFRPNLDEVNFWQPGGNRRFQALETGAPFLFKLHSPRNFIVGGGFFVHSSVLPCSLAWEAFADKNGAPTLADMRRQIEQYRRAVPNLRADYNIGCIILGAPFFFDEPDWIPVPGDFSLNIPGKTYDLTSPIGQNLWEAVQRRLPSPPSHQADSQPPMFGSAVPVRPRLGQGAFRVLITDTYERRCAVTQERALPVLEAAHVRSVSQGGFHEVDNGLLLRSDIHRLFDRGYVTVTPDYRFRVSRKLKEDFDNGEPYYPIDGQSIWVPRQPGMRPRRSFLEWHADSVYKG